MEHASRRVYTENVEAVNAKLAEAESEWPEYKTNATLTAIPSYSVKTDHDTTGRNLRGVEWLRYMVL